MDLKKNFWLRFTHTLQKSHSLLSLYGLLFLAPNCLFFLFFNLHTNTAYVFDCNCFFNFQTFWIPTINSSLNCCFVLVGTYLFIELISLRPIFHLGVCFGELLLLFVVVVVVLGFVREDGGCSICRGFISDGLSHWAMFVCGCSPHN